MSFGSYDESEPENQTVSTVEDDAVSVHENEHEGELTFETDATTAELVDKLGEIKDDGGDDD